jgi:hypothetical protein
MERIRKPFKRNHHPMIRRNGEKKKNKNTVESLYKNTFGTARAYSYKVRILKESMAWHG